MTDICFVRPPILVPGNSPIVQFTPPIGLAYVAGACVESGFGVAVVDALGEGLEQRRAAEKNCMLYGLEIDQIIDRIPVDTQVVALSAAFTFEWPTCRDLITRIREKFPLVKIVAGGEHITAMPHLSLEQSPLDVAVLGEGEGVILQLLRAILDGRLLGTVPGIVYKDEAGSLVATTGAERLREIDEIPRPAWDLFPLNEYLDRGMGFGVNRGRSMPVLASRGCPFQCTFCSSPQMWTTRWVARDVDLLLDELQEYQKKYRVTNFDFYDLTAIVKKKWIVEFCQKIKDRGMVFTWQLPSGTRTEAIDEEVSKLLYDSGCRNMSYSPESGSERTLTAIKKKVNKDSVIESIRGAVRSGINVKVNLIIGFPDETLRDVIQSGLFGLRMAAAGAHDISVFAFSPYPGSELFERLVNEGKIEVDENYFDRLRTYADTPRTISLSDDLSATQLIWSRNIMTASFYLAQWTTHPWRPFQMILNIARGRQESRSEKALQTVLYRLKVFMMPRWIRNRL